MPEREIVIRIKNGQVEIEAVGFSGSKCLEATRPYEKDLGGVVKRKKKPEFLSGETVIGRGKNRVTS